MIIGMIGDLMALSDHALDLLGIGPDFIAVHKKRGLCPVGG